MLNALDCAFHDRGPSSNPTGNVRGRRLREARMKQRQQHYTGAEPHMLAGSDLSREASNDTPRQRILLHAHRGNVDHNSPGWQSFGRLAQLTCIVRHHRLRETPWLTGRAGPRRQGTDAAQETTGGAEAGMRRYRQLRGLLPCPGPST